MSESSKIKARIENLMSKILSSKHNAKITIKFREVGTNGDRNKSGAVEEE